MSLAPPIIFNEAPAALTAEVAKHLAGPGPEGCRVYLTDNGLRVIWDRPRGVHGRLIHVSISHRDRHPTWEEIKAAKDRFFGDAHDAIMVFPRSELWVNIHPNCFHLWELPKIPGPSGRWEYQ